MNQPPGEVSAQAPIATFHPELTEIISGDPAVRDLLADVREPGAVAEVVAPDEVHPFIAAAMAKPESVVVLATGTIRQAEDLIPVLETLVGADQVAYFPAWETLPHERLSPRSDTVGRRLDVIRRVVHDPVGVRPQIVVAPIRSLLQPQVPGLSEIEPVVVKTGQEVSLDDVVARLSAAAYQRIDLVQNRGQFAVRGGIVDVFPPTSLHPVRIEFWGDEVEEIREFQVADQRTVTVLDEIVAPGCSELVLTEEVRSKAAALAASHPSLAEIFTKIAEGQHVEGMESLAPVLAGEMELFVDLLPAGSSVVMADPERIRSRAADLVATSQEFLAASWAASADGAEAPIDLDAATFRELSEIREHISARGLALIDLSPFAVDGAATVGASNVPDYRGDLDAVLADVRAWRAAGDRIVVVAPGRGQAERSVEWLAENEIPVHFADRLETTDESGLVDVICGEVIDGFRLDSVGVVVLTHDDFVGQRTRDRVTRSMPVRRRKQIDPLELEPGDPVVHEQHGVGRYVELINRVVQGAARDYLVIEYAPSKRGHPPDRLFVPMDQLDLISRYVGGESPTLDKLGGSDWSQRKSRARKAVRQIANELIALYAARQSSKGHAFGPDTPWQAELEDSFSFVETPDQLATIEEVKRDMERVVPMDRLVCGDVGYGKTEIAVRAAFKAIQDGKQVVLLVPTTLLVQQHLATFAERFGQFPVTIKPLSRFQTDSEAKATLAGLADGSVDLVIGTHRLLQPGVRIKDLGLVIVDEEQRFGVEHKEALKHLRASVDVLSMSATPIPRTLEMAITGIREMSTIATPPEERHPVLSFVGPWDEAQVTAAIRRELLREGQVFYIHNRVQSIDKAAARLAELVPEARIAAAHGQMGEARLEEVMVKFWEGEIDVLVCTTIVESGLDVSNANTMIIERADTLGLSQLHQLRGRVGRSRERAYAYFLYPPEKPLSETAHERLRTIASHSELGGGMAVALKDLEIRGAGNLLGGEQSGHIADVGFDLYIRLVGEAVAEFRGEGEPEPEVRFELPVEAHLPHDYVASERLRLEMYKRLAQVRSEADIAELVEELRDRYGPLPEPAELLIDVARLRVKARAQGLTEISAAGSNIRFAPVELPESGKVRIARVYPKSIYKEAAKVLILPQPRQNVIGGKPLTGPELLEWLSGAIDTIGG